VFKITLKKFILPKSKKKVYLCQRHWDKSAEVDEIIYFLEHPKESGYDDMKKLFEKKKKEDELKIYKRKITWISIISISIILLLSIIFKFK
jgi:hypothetical protein